MSSKRQTKAAALRALKEARSGKVSSGLDSYEVKDEGDVYDVYDESEYQNLVESRRQREDFVVDDDGIGYFDDGEERLGDEDGDASNANKNKKRSGATANLTAEALKKARKTHKLRQAQAPNHDQANSNTKNAAGESQKSLWEFVNQGPSTTAAATALAVDNRATVTANDNLRKSTNSANLDSLLDELDDVPAKPRSSKRNHSNTNRSRYTAKSRTSHSDSLVNSTRRRHATSTNAIHVNSTNALRTPKREPTNDNNIDSNVWADDDNNNIDSNMHTAIATDIDIDANPGTPVKHSTIKEEIKSNTIDMDIEKEQELETDFAPSKAEASNKDKPELDSEPKSDKPVARKRLKSKFGRLSAPAQKALELEQKKEQARLAAQPDRIHIHGNAIGNQKPHPSAILTTAPSSVDTNSSSFKPDVIAVDSTQSATAAANLESVLQRKKGNDSDNAQSYIDMFCIDVSERNGVVHLYGKVQVPTDANNAKPSFVSACAVVKNNLRNLLVLPRKNSDTGEYASIMDVHAEIKSVLQPSCIPHVQGATWAGKVVKRKYAFDDPSIPREETQYLKVVYDAKYPVPSQEICSQGGTHFDRILNAGSSNLENFIIKRKLMGPCWIRVQNPLPPSAATSWCKLEFICDNPKNIKRLDLVETGAPRSPPPVVTMSLKLKTIVNPKTHKSEIVSVSAICHKQVLLDTASDESTRHMTQLSLIRPLGTAVISNNDNNGLANGLSQFPRDIDQEIKTSMPQLQRMPNERALLSRLFTQIGTWDPDVLVGHNAWGYDMELLLSRSVELKVAMWSKIGRRRKMQIPSKTLFSSTSKDWAIADALTGRLLCDTYVSSKELLRETTYSLTSLASTQLKTNRTDIQPVDIPQWYNSSKTIVQLARHTLFDAQLVQRLMFKLQILPLTKQLTCVAGNLWARTMKGNRAERNEYLLLHEFHQLKYISPEKKRGFSKGGGGEQQQAGGGRGKQQQQTPKKSTYSGGLVLEPKKGLYDSFILLLDFNSLYPSLIQEYNLCFTTMDWSPYQNRIQEQSNSESTNSNLVQGGPSLPPLPDEAIERGVLPRVIKSLVERRRAVKKMLKNEKDADKRQELDIRQQALKLTANSMYGCLGFSHSRFYAQPIAAMVTAMGRETLQRTVDVAQDTVGLEVIYGDTDSIMINTRISDQNDFSKVFGLGEKVKKEVNRLYKTLELEIDGVFSSMLLLKKKKYAAVTCTQKPDGTLEYGKETKGLDLVRRDWCIQSKDTGRYVLDQILSGDDREVVVKNIHDHLEELAKKMRASELPLDKYVITKGLSKHPNDYPDGKSQPHVQVAKAMLKNNRPVNTGDHIPYIITSPIENSGEKSNNVGLPTKAPTAVERARHPEEMARSDGTLKPDVEWYLTNQILPPISRLCEPIDGTSQSIIAEKLGLDSQKYNNISRSGGAEIDDDELVDYTPASSLSDEERFKDVTKLELICLSCGVKSEFPGVYCAKKDATTGGITLTAGLQCVNPDCHHPEFWGLPSHFDCLSRVSNAVSSLVHAKMKKYYQGWVRCDDPTCNLVQTRQLSVAGNVCLARGCNGRMHSTYDEKAMHTQLKYLDALFDASHACNQLDQKKFGTKAELLKSISRNDKVTFDELHQSANKYLKGSAYNWIGTSLWKTLFGPSVVSAKQ